MKSSDVGLSAQLARLRSCFKRLRQHKAMRGVMTGGVYFLEITLNARTRQWHPHLHVLFEGQYQHKSVWSKLWLEVTGDSYIIDIRRVENSAQAAGYISKYAGKPIRARVSADIEAFTELMGALMGGKTFHVFGDWRNLELSKPRADDTEWIAVMPLANCLEQAANGDERCRAILSYLRRRNADEPMDNESEPP